MSARTIHERGDDIACPRYEVVYERPRLRKWAICVFVINEGEKIRKQLNSMAAYNNLVDIIVADGGSTDGSLDSELLRETGGKALLVKSGVGKLSAQMRMAFDYGLSEGYEAIIVIDGNGKDGLAGIPRMVEALEQGYDHVQGSRFIPGGHHENTPLTRYLAVNLLHAPLISLVSGFRYTDTTNGFRAYSARLLKNPRLGIFRSCFDRYQLHYYLAIYAVSCGYKVCEIPVSRIYPAKGKIPTKIQGVAGLVGVLKQLWDTCTGVYDIEE